MEKSTIKKIISWVSIVCVILSATIGILLLLKVLKGSTFIGNTYLSLLTIFMAGLFVLNAIDVITEKKIIGYVTIGLIGLSALLILIYIWANKAFGDFGSVYLKITIWIAVVTILFDVIVSTVILLEKKLLYLQIPYYVTTAYLELALALLITGATDVLVVKQWQIFLIVGIIMLALLIVIKIKSKEYRDDGAKPATVSKDKVVLTMEEYNKLLSKISELEAKLKEKSEKTEK